MVKSIAKSLVCECMNAENGQQQVQKCLSYGKMYERYSVIRLREKDARYNAKMMTMLFAPDTI